MTGDQRPMPGADETAPRRAREVTAAAGASDDTAADQNAVDARIEQILTRLDGLGELEVAAHTELYLEVHDRLSVELNSEAGPQTGQKQGQEPAGAHGTP
ncbi:hypothetical protein E8P82_13925 [Arthrobacter echini]|uniref:Uncharacterized protein n=1 Tax=Arthrobacter echini TaxID=1529066 RepID=A0A4V3Z5B9_9MICC|nr:hypothetical protein [Arthrobacter echini]THJ64869.1 hypothetical protein E8P82_13925 [Arthrobacter echini]